jgi:small basic protein
MGFLFLCLIGIVLGIIYGIWWVLLTFPVVSMWIGIAIVVSLSYMIGTSLDEIEHQA